MSILSTTAEQLNDDAVQYFKEEGKLDYIFPSQPIYRWLWQHSTALVLYELNFEALQKSYTEEDKSHIAYAWTLPDQEMDVIRSCKFIHHIYRMMPQSMTPVIVNGASGGKPTYAKEMGNRVRLPNAFDIQDVKRDEWPEWIIDQRMGFNPALSGFKIYLKNCEWPLDWMPDSVAFENPSLQFYPIKDVLKTKKIEIMV